MFAFLKSIVLMQENLKDKGKFANLPHYDTYLDFMGNESLAKQKNAFKVLMKSRFGDLGQYDHDILDDRTRIALIIAPPMDAWSLQTLKFLLLKDDAAEEKTTIRLQEELDHQRTLTKQAESPVASNTGNSPLATVVPYTPNLNISQAGNGLHWSSPLPAPKKHDPSHLIQHKQTRSADFTANRLNAAQEPTSPSPRPSRFTSGIPKSQSAPMVISRVVYKRALESGVAPSRVMGGMTRESAARTLEWVESTGNVGEKESSSTNGHSK